MTDTIFLSDYQPYPYLIDQVSLTFRLAPAATLVAARIAFRPNPARPGRHDLRLNGEFVPGAESWINLSFLRTREHLDGVQHKARKLGDAEGHNVADFTLEPQGDSTQVTWAMYGPTPFVSKVMQVFISMDGLIGKDFAAGLANLKAAAEK